MSYLTSSQGPEQGERNRDRGLYPSQPASELFVTLLTFKGRSGFVRLWLLALVWQACLIAQRVLLFFFFFPQGLGHLRVWGPSLSDQILHLFIPCGCLVTVNNRILQCSREFVTEFITDPTRRPHLNNLRFLIQERLSPRTSLPTPGC